MKKILCVLSCIIALSLAQTNLPLLSSQTCAGKTNSIDCGKNNVVLISEAFHGVRAVNEGQCEYTPGDCTQSTTTNCGAIQTCATLLTSNTSLSNCGNQKAQYLTKRYYCPPISGVTQYDICSTNEITATSGSIISPNYPKYAPTSSPCVVKLVAPAGKTFNIYPADVSLAVRNSDDECTDYVKIIDTTGEKILCARERESFANKFCSNVIYITYSAITPQTPILSTYKGFNFYFEVSDQSPNSGCPIETPPPPTFMSTTTALVSTTTFPPHDEVFSSILTTGGNANGEPCYFPFKYNSTLSMNTCQNEGRNWWCSTTMDYEHDRIRGDCKRGLTENKKFKVCFLQTRNFSCPENYLINLLSVEGYKTSDGSCDETKPPECVQDFYNILQVGAGGKQSHRMSAVYTMTECNSSLVNLVLVDYNCIPDSVPYLKSSNVCDNGETAEEAGLITSPNYPNFESNINNCAFTVKTINNTPKIFTLYSINTTLHVPLNNQSCSEAYIQVNGGERICGLRSTQKIWSKCGTKFKVSYYVSPRVYKGFKFFYELTDALNPQECDVSTEEPETGTTTTNDIMTTETTTETKSPIIYTSITTGSTNSRTTTETTIKTTTITITRMTTTPIIHTTQSTHIYTDEPILTEASTARTKETTTNRLEETTVNEMTITTVLTSNAIPTTTSISSTDDLSAQSTTTPNIPTDSATKMITTSKDEESIEVLSIGAILGIAIGSAVIVSTVVSAVVFVAVYYLCIRTPKKVSPTNDIQMT